MWMLDFFNEVFMAFHGKLGPFIVRSPPSLFVYCIVTVLGHLSKQKLPTSIGPSPATLCPSLRCRRSQRRVSHPRKPPRHGDSWPWQNRAANGIHQRGTKNRNRKWWALYGFPISQKVQRMSLPTTLCPIFLPQQNCGPYKIWFNVEELCHHALDSRAVKAPAKRSKRGLSLKRVLGTSPLFLCTQSPC